MPRWSAASAARTSGSRSANTAGAFATALIARISEKAGRPLTATEDTNVRFAFQLALGTINNAIINRPGPIMLGQAQFIANLVRAVRIVSDYDNLVGLEVERGESRMHLFDEKRHERLVDDPWDAAAAANAIRDVAAEALAASRNGLWPAHPLDDMPNDGATLYTGAAGMLWGLSHLASVGAIEADERIGAWARELPARYRAAPDTGSRVPSYLLGETGVLLTALRARPRAEWFDDLLAAVNSNIENPTLEALWGAPGTMLAAVFAADLTADERWREAYAANVAALARTWLPHEGDACDLWMQDLYGKRQKYLGPAHGFAGNVYGMLRRPDWLASTERASIQARAIRSVARDGRRRR